MRVLLDECVHAGLKKALPRHKILTVSDMGWNGITNGRLLQLISGQFNLFITVDTKMPHQQNLKGLPFAIFFLAIADNNFSSYTPLLPLLELNIPSALPGKIIYLP